MKKYTDKTLSAQERAELLVSEMSIHEQAEQLRYDAPAIKRLGIPEYNWWNEGLHGAARAGVATMFPQAIGIAATFDVSLTEKIAKITAEEARAKYNTYTAHEDRDIYKGLTLWSPNINIFRDPRWGRGHETYGEDPFLTAELGKAFVKGLQGDSEYLKTAACAKHFAVHSGPEDVRHEFNAIVSKKDIEETYLPAFEALVKEAKVESVMGAYNRVNGEACCASEFLMNKLEEWDFDGYFVSDCWAIKDFHEKHGITKNAVESAALAIKSGCDLNCGCSYVNLLTALEIGLIEPEDITKSCINLMRTRMRLGMFDETEFDQIPFEVISSPEHKKVSLECAEKSIVLLKNDGILPLDKNKIKTIGVIGPNANSREALNANYCGTADRYITFLEGLQDEFDGRIFYSEGCHLYKDKISLLANPGDRLVEAMNVALNSDVVILCLGLDASLEGEEGDTGNEFSSGDKKNLRLPESQRLLLEKVISVGKPVIAVVASGSAINIEADTSALLQAWYAGSEGGTALANIIFGKTSPSGKLPVTFYENSNKLPDFTDYSMKGRTYRYLEDNVLYPFGFGLTYSKIECTSIKYSNGAVIVTAENIGDIATDDVIQIYIKDYCENAVLNHSLCGFKRINLQAGEIKEFKIPIIDKSFTAVDDNGVRKIYGDKFTLYAGTSQPDKQSERLMGVKCISTEILLSIAQ